MANIRSVDLQTYIRDLIDETFRKPESELRSYENVEPSDGKDVNTPSHPDELDSPDNDHYPNTKQLRREFKMEKQICH